jgi:predicted acetyltransferase
MSEIKLIPSENLDGFIDIFADAYPGAKVHTQADKDKLCERLKEQHADPRISVYGLYREGKLLGGMRLFDFTMNLFGHKVLAGGVGTIAVEFLHKKEHVAKELMQFYMDYYRQKKAPLLVLWPFRPDFYRKMGFGLGARINRYSVKPDSLPATGSREHARYLTADDIPALNDCYNRCVDKTTGMIEELEIHWQAFFTPTSTMKLVGYEREGKLRAYLRFRFLPGDSGNWLDNKVDVVECVYEDREAFAGLLAFLHTQFDQIERVIFTTSDDTFYYLPEDPRNGTQNVMRPVYHESNVCGVGIMYRVLNLERLFDVLKDYDFNGQNCRLKLMIRDSFFQENDGARVIHFEGGRARLVPKGDCDVEVAMDVADFSSMFMGAVTFEKLHEYGLADISDTAYLGTANRIFYREHKPVCLTSF